jgi:hypothetical protein
MTRFAELAKLEYYELQKLFSAWDKKETPERKKRFEELIQLAKDTKNVTTPRDLTLEKRTAIKTAIESAGGVHKFCEDHPEFNPTSLWQIMKGRRKTVSASVKKLLETLKIAS